MKHLFRMRCAYNDRELRLGYDYTMVEIVAKTKEEAWAEAQRAGGFGAFRLESIKPVPQQLEERRDGYEEARAESCSV